MGYKGIYFQKEKTGSPVKESVSDFSIWCKEMPFQLFSDAKELQKTDWMDEHGDDEYIPNELKLQAYSMDVTFCYKGDMGTANDKIKAFMQYLTGMDGGGSTFKVYDGFTRIGRQHVRYESFDPDGEIVRDEHEGDVIVFKVKLKVNDPVTDIYLTK